MKTFLNLFLIFVLIGSTASAQSVNPDVSVTAVQLIQKNGKFKYMLRCQTTTDFNNTSTLIVYTQKRKGDHFEIVFIGTKTPSKVTKGIGPATAYIPLGKLKDGEYSFSFTSRLSGGEIKWESRLKISGEKFDWL